MFVENKYYKWYSNIVSIAKNRNSTSTYSEKHHIIPRSLGGSNDASNLVILTAKEHFICHLLLPKFTTGNDRHKMIYALNGMCNVKRDYQNRYTPSSRTYAIARRDFSIVHSSNISGRTLTDEHKAKISASGKGRKDTLATIEKRSKSLTGKKRSPEQRDAMKLAQLNRPRTILSDDEKKIDTQKRSLAQLGKHSGPKSTEHKAKISATLTGKYLGVAKSETTKLRMRKPKSEEHKKAISDARISKYAAIRKANSENP